MGRINLRWWGRSTSVTAGERSFINTMSERRKCELESDYVHGDIC